MRAEDSWAGSWRAKLAASESSASSLEEKNQELLWCVNESIALPLPVRLCTAGQGRKVWHVGNAQIIGWKSGNCVLRSPRCYI